ncbi:MAG: YdcH family protein [Pseudomonadota bacterium]
MDEKAMRARLRALIVEHRDLDAAIAAMADDMGSDRLQVQRLKKRKLALKDEISRIEDILVPDIIA